MSDSSELSLIGKVELNQEQLQLILSNQQLFMSIFQEQISAVIKEQAKTNSLLVALIEAMGDGEDESSLGPATYLDGRPMG